MQWFQHIWTTRADLTVLESEGKLLGIAIASQMGDTLHVDWVVCFSGQAFAELIIRIAHKYPGTQYLEYSRRGKQRQRVSYNRLQQLIAKRYGW